MTAIFEFVMPKSCAECPLMYKTDLIEVCAAVKKFPNDALRREERACFCPLKTPEEYSEYIRPKARAVVVGDNGNIYCPSCKRKIGAFHGRNYCPDCGQKIDWEESQ